jgi:3-hydroxy-9,10-secoandrosta-1,3,5(10)-triene-9,17-dione monooxygenase reductase component
MDVDADAFRQVMGQFATGVTVVTALDGDRPVGITVNALSSISLEPPLVMVALDRRRRATPALRACGRYAVNILGEDQRALSDCFAGAPVTPDREAFCGAAWVPGPTSGMPLLAGAIASLECEIVEELPVGDHLLFIGRALALTGGAGERQPLLYFRRRYLRLERGSATAVGGREDETR